MNGLLNNPVFQSSLVPFIAALVSGLLLQRFAKVGTGLMVIIGFYITVSLVTELQLFPLTSTRKILLLGIVASAVGVSLDLYRGPRRFIAPLLTITGIAAIIWVLWPVLSRREGMTLWTLAGGGSLYVAWMIITVVSLRNHALQSGVVTLALGVATGVSALIGATALLGQISSALAAGAGAYLLLCLFLPKIPAGSALTLPVALLTGLLGYAAHVYASLPGLVLLIIALIPLLVRIPLPKSKPPWQQLALLLLASSPAIIGAIVVTLQIAGAPPL